MDKIRKLKSPNQYKNYDEMEEDCNKRVKEIQKYMIERKQNLLKFNNESLLHIEKLLRKKNIYFIREKIFYSLYGDLFFADFFIPSLNITIEIDGGYHSTDKRKYLDKAKEEFLASRRIATIRFTNEQALELKYITRNTLYYTAEKFWKKFDSFTMRQNEKRWSYRALGATKENYINLISDKHAELISTIDCNSPIEEVDKQGNIFWRFENIFEAHFQTGVKFRDIMGRFNMRGTAWKTKFRFIDSKETVDENKSKKKTTNAKPLEYLQFDFLHWMESGGKKE